MAEHPIENVMKTTMENLKEMIDVNTIVGDIVETAEGTVIVPISKVSLVLLLEAVSIRRTELLKG